MLAVKHTTYRAGSSPELVAFSSAVDDSAPGGAAGEVIGERESCLESAWSAVGVALVTP